MHFNKIQYRRKIVGEFDFGCFATQSADKNTIRTIYGIQVTTYRYAVFQLKAQHFYKSC